MAELTRPALLRPVWRQAEHPVSELRRHPPFRFQVLPELRLPLWRRTVRLRIGQPAPGMKTKPPLWFTVLSITGALLEEAAIALVVLRVLPIFDIHVPAWGLAIMMAAFALYSYNNYRIGRPTLLLPPRLAPEAIIGQQGQVVRQLAPVGYVKVQGVLWKAVSVKPGLSPGDDVVVVGIDRLKLVVAPKKGLRADRRTR